MITGVITTKHVFLHPHQIIAITGFMTFWKVLIKAASPHSYHFIDFIMKGC